MDSFLSAIGTLVVCDDWLDNMRWLNRSSTSGDVCRIIEEGVASEEICVSRSSVPVDTLTLLFPNNGRLLSRAPPEGDFNRVAGPAIQDVPRLYWRRRKTMASDLRSV